LTNSATLSLIYSPFLGWASFLAWPTFFYIPLGLLFSNELVLYITVFSCTYGCGVLKSYSGLRTTFGEGTTFGD